MSGFLTTPWIIPQVLKQVEKVRKEQPISIISGKFRAQIIKVFDYGDRLYVIELSDQKNSCKAFVPRELMQDYEEERKSYLGLIGAFVLIKKFKFIGDNAKLEIVLEQFEFCGLQGSLIVGMPIQINSGKVDLLDQVNFLVDFLKTDALKLTETVTEGKNSQVELLDPPTPIKKPVPTPNQKFIGWDDFDLDDEEVTVSKQDQEVLKTIILPPSLDVSKNSNTKTIIFPVSTITAISGAKAQAKPESDIYDDDISDRALLQLDFDNESTQSDGMMVDLVADSDEEERCESDREDEEVKLRISQTVPKPKRSPHGVKKFSAVMAYTAIDSESDAECIIHPEISSKTTPEEKQKLEEAEKSHSRSAEKAIKSLPVPAKFAELSDEELLDDEVEFQDPEDGRIHKQASFTELSDDELFEDALDDKPSLNEDEGISASQSQPCEIFDLFSQSPASLKMQISQSDHGNDLFTQSESGNTPMAVSANPENVIQPAEKLIHETSDRGLPVTAFIEKVDEDKNALQLDEKLTEETFDECLPVTGVEDVENLEIVTVNVQESAITNNIADVRVETDPIHTVGISTLNENNKDIAAGENQERENLDGTIEVEVAGTLDRDSRTVENSGINVHMVVQKIAHQMKETGPNDAIIIVNNVMERKDEASETVESDSARKQVLEEHTENSANPLCGMNQPQSTLPYEDSGNDDKPDFVSDEEEEAAPISPHYLSAFSDSESDEEFFDSLVDLEGLKAANEEESTTDRCESNFAESVPLDRYYSQDEKSEVDVSEFISQAIPLETSTSADFKLEPSQEFEEIASGIPPDLNSCTQADGLFTQEMNVFGTQVPELAQMESCHPLGVEDEEKNIPEHDESNGDCLFTQEMHVFGTQIPELAQVEGYQPLRVEDAEKSIAEHQQSNVNLSIGLKDTENNILEHGKSNGDHALGLEETERVENEIIPEKLRKNEEVHEQKVDKDINIAESDVDMEISSTADENHNQAEEGCDSNDIDEVVARTFDEIFPLDEEDDDSILDSFFLCMQDSPELDNRDADLLPRNILHFAERISDQVQDEFSDREEMDKENMGMCVGNLNGKLGICDAKANAKLSRETSIISSELDMKNTQEQVLEEDMALSQYSQSQLGTQFTPQRVKSSQVSELESTPKNNHVITSTTPEGSPTVPRNDLYVKTVTSAAYVRLPTPSLSIPSSLLSLKTQADVSMRLTQSADSNFPSSDYRRKLSSEKMSRLSIGMKKISSYDFTSRKPIGIIFPSRRRSSLSPFSVKRPFDGEELTERKRRKTNYQWMPID